MEKFHIAWARLVSALLNPLLMPAYAFLLLFSFQAYFSFIIPLQAKMLILLVLIVNTALLPLISLLVLKRMGMITSLNLEKREDRLYPLLLGTVLLYLSWILLRKLNLPGIYSTFLFGATLLTLLILLISWKYKISMHTASAGGVLGMLLGLHIQAYVSIIPLISLCFFLSGLIGSARLILRAHTPAQVYSGFLLGAGTLLAVFLLSTA
jgi:membrane-associated phospholipid phosphatase